LLGFRDLMKVIGTAAAARLIAFSSGSPLTLPRPPAGTLLSPRRGPAPTRSPRAGMGLLSVLPLPPRALPPPVPPCFATCPRVPVRSWPRSLAVRPWRIVAGRGTPTAAGR
jgi:hypothetical protein